MTLFGLWWYGVRRRAVRKVVKRLPWVFVAVRGRLEYKWEPWSERWLVRTTCIDGVPWSARCALHPDRAETVVTTGQPAQHWRLGWWRR